MDTQVCLQYFFFENLENPRTNSIDSQTSFIIVLYCYNEKMLTEIEIEDGREAS